MAMRFWVCAMSHDRVLAQVARGRLVLGADARDEVLALGESDGIVCYSARERAGDPARVQLFTALGRVAPGEPERVLNGWGRAVDWDQAAEPIGLRPIASALQATEDLVRWGRRLKAGIAEIDRGDFELLARQMRPRHPDERRR